MADIKQTFSFETYVVDSLKELNKKMDELGTVFVPRTEILLMAKERDERIRAIHEDVQTIKDNDKWRNRIIIGTLVTSGGSLAVMLITKFF